MINEMREFVLELVQSEYETGHILAEDRNEFNELCRDEGYRATKAMYDLYEECHNLGPAGFYAEYKDELDFDPMFVSEYGDGEDDEESYLTGEDLRVAIDEEMPFIRENIGENGTLEDAINDFMLACEESNMSADRSEVEAILADYFDSELDDTIIEEALSNKEKLKRAYPELNFDNPVTETLTEAIDVEDKMQTAVGILYDMDNFVLSAYDNDYWLTMGVPDGEFTENDRDLAEANYDEHKWLIEDEGFDTEAFKDLLDAFQDATDGSDYDQNERARIIHEAETILNMTESAQDMNRRCEECNALLNDMGKCPRCDDGEEDLDEAALLEWGKTDFNKLANNDDKAKKKANDKLINNFAKILFYSFKAGDKNRYYTEKNQKIEYEDLKEIFRKYSDIINNPTAANLTAEKDIIPNLTKLIDLIVIDSKDNIIRRGLEVFKPGQFVFVPNRSSLFKIKPEFTAEKFFESIVGVKSETTEPDSSSQPEAETKEEATPENANTETVSSSEDQPATSDTTSLPNWITNESIKAAITLLAKRKNGSANYYDAEGNLVDYKTISTDNIDKVFLDKEATKPFIDALKEVKAGLAKRKAAAIKSAALFGESYDDSLEYDNYEDTEITEDIDAEELEQLINNSKNIANDTMDAAGKAVVDAVKNDESPVAALNKFSGAANDLETIDEEFSEEVLKEEFSTYADIKADFEANQIHYAQQEAFEEMLIKAAKALKCDINSALIYKDNDREFDPIYFADDAKEIQYNVFKVKAFDLEVVRIEFKGSIYIVFRNQADADIYMTYAH